MRRRALPRVTAWVGAALVSLSAVTCDHTPLHVPPDHGFVKDVPLFGQQASAWCWAASAQMIASYHKKKVGAYLPPLQQWQIANVTYPPPIVACPENTCNGFELFDRCSDPHDIELFHFGLGSKITDWPLSWDEIRQEVLEQRPLIYAYCTTTQPDRACSSEDSGHMVVIDGFFRLRLGNGRLNLLRVKDPLPCCRGEVLYLSYARYKRSGALEREARYPGDPPYRRHHVQTYYCVQDMGKSCKPASVATSDAQSATLSNAAAAGETDAGPDFATPAAAAAAVLEALRADPAEARVFLGSFLPKATIDSLDLASLRQSEAIPRDHLAPAAIVEKELSADTLDNDMVDSRLQTLPIVAGSSGQPLFAIIVERTDGRFTIAEIGRPVSSARSYEAAQAPSLPGAIRVLAREFEVPGYGISFLMTEHRLNGKTERRYSSLSECSGIATGRRVNAMELVDRLQRLVR